MSAIDEVKQRTDIVEVIGQYTALKKAGRNLTALCPFHSEKNPSFFVYPEQQSWHCFGACNTGGDVFSFIMKKEGLDFGETLRLLAQRAGVSLPTRMEREGDKEEKAELYQVNEAAALYFNNLLLNSPGAARARSYIDKRGFSPKTVADFQLGFSLDSWESLKQYLLAKGHSESTMLTTGLLIEAENGKTHDRFRGKLMFPIRDNRGRTIGFGARVLDDSLPKYTNSPQTPVFDKSGSLYGIDMAAPNIRQQDSAIIMEGYMDVITAHQNGVTNAVASMGTSVTETQVSTLKKLSRNLVLALDADTAGGEAMLRGTGYEKLLNADEKEIEEAWIQGISYENLLDSEIRVVVMPEGSDPDDVIKEDINAWQSLVSQAIPLIDYMFSNVTSRLDLTTARDKPLAIERLLPIVAEIKNPTRRSHYIQKLASLIKQDVRTIEAALSQLKPPPVRRKTPEPKPSAVPRALRPLMSNPREEYCLALLLQHPELKNRLGDLSPEYFESSENREIFTAWQKTPDFSSLKGNFDIAINEYIDAIISKNTNKSLTSADIEKRLADCTLELRKQSLKNRAAKLAEILALETQSGETGADPARLEKEEELIEISTELKEVYARKNRKRPAIRR